METVENTFKDYWSISQSINRFETDLKTTSVDAQERQSLHRQLDTIYEALEALQAEAAKTNAVVLPLLAQIQQQLIGLYGKVEEFFENHSVSSIAGGALQLSSLLATGKMDKATQFATYLKEQIKNFSSQRLPSLHNRRILALAEKLSNQAQDPQESKAKLYCLQLTHLLKTLVEENLEKVRSFLYPEEAELAIELYEIAELYGEYQEQKGWQKLRPFLYRLPSLEAKGFSALSSKEKAALLTELADEIAYGGVSLQSDAWRFSENLV
jgi:hypothetical protein